MIQIAPSARISPLCDLEPSVKGTQLVIGERTMIDSFVKIKPAGGMGHVLIGDDVAINSGCVLYSGNGIRIGNNVAIAANCTLAPTNHEYRSAQQLIKAQGFMPSKGGIVIEDDVWIGANCVLLDGCVLGQGCVVSAGSVVRSSIPPYTIWGGQPLRQIGQRQ
jgi:virginiamycin A acetyltransferase